MVRHGDEIRFLTGYELEGSDREKAQGSCNKQCNWECE